MRHVTFLRPALGEGFSADAMTPPLAPGQT